MLDTPIHNMMRIVSDEDNLQQLDQLWDMYENGVNAELFSDLSMWSIEDLEQYPEDNIFHKIMADFILNYRRAYNR